MNMQTLHLIMEGDKAVTSFTMKPNEIGFEQVVHYAKRFIGEYDGYDVLVIQCPDDVDIDIDPVAGLFFVRDEESSNNSDTWRDWGIIQLGLSTPLSRIVEDYDLAHS